MKRLELDIDQFWIDDEKAHQDNCFSKDAPQVALGIRMSSECVFEELGVQGDPWAPINPVKQNEWNKRYNDKAEKIVGKRLLPEDYPPEIHRFPYVKRIGEVFGGSYKLLEDSSEWLTESVSNEKELESLLDRVDKLDLRDFMLPPNWEKEKKRLFEMYGLKPEPQRHVRGPITLACSIMGSENFLFLCMDEPDLAKRFSDTIARVIIDMTKISDQEANVDEKTLRGFSFADDNCCLLTPEIYEWFGYPILKNVFDHFSPDSSDWRFQHSDSGMEHLLPVLGRLHFSAVNFGPTVLVPAIRKYMPDTCIQGCLAPFAFMRNDEKEITMQVLRDCEDAKDQKGLLLTTAGSINNGSSLESMRLVMALIQNYGKG